MVELCPHSGCMDCCFQMVVGGPEHLSVLGREASGNVAENLLRDFEDKWWKASREVAEQPWLQPPVHQVQLI